MEHLKQAIASLLLCLALPASAASVWKISSDTHSSYIAGTIHILSPEDYPLPAEYEQAFAKADKLVFETDIAKVNSMEYQQLMLAKMLYPEGMDLQKALKPDTFAALSQYLSERNIPISNMLRFKPGMVAISLSLLELQKLGFTSVGVDQYYADKAAEQGLPLGWLETPEQQLEFLVNMGGEDESTMIDYALRDAGKLPEMINSLRDSWRSGDMQTMSRISIDEFKADYPQIYQELLVTRNNNWLPQITAMLADDTVEFILVGAMHLAGPDSVLNKLAAQGYKIEKL